ncbi:MAG: tRNA (guanosine(46)-N7)-methyltransferase TrmB [Pseudomonadota bacterium]|nr:tRNA (guanosine(46)-N7)-methyltransferase TrmB [Pseudomonadota bacterium]
MEELLPRLVIKDEEMRRWEDRGKLAASLFPHLPSSPHPLIFLEIGFGGGEHLAHQAALHPDAGIIGCEPFINGIAALLAALPQSPPALKERTEVGVVSSLTPTPTLPLKKRGGNIRIFPGDARLLMEKLPDASLSKVFILYPDPWPKARHHKRRLVSTEFLDALARVMKPGAELRLATDDEDYVTRMLERLLAHPGYVWNAESCADWLSPPPDWISTRYEQKALKAGRVPTYLSFLRKQESSSAASAAQ